MQALTVSSRATQGSILGGMETLASILDLTVMAKMETLDSTLEGMEILDSILDQAVMAKMETLGLTLEEMESQGSTEDQRCWSSLTPYNTSVFKRQIFFLVKLYC